MKCRNPGCNKNIPPTRKASAGYCSDECSYTMRKERSKIRYAEIIKPLMEIRKNENILSRLYEMQKLKKPISGTDLETLGFNFGFSTNECEPKKGVIARIVGSYAYHLQSNDNLIIWRLDSSL